MEIGARGAGVRVLLYSGRREPQVRPDGSSYLEQESYLKGALRSERKPGLGAGVTVLDGVYWTGRGDRRRGGYSGVRPGLPDCGRVPARIIRMREEEPGP